MKSIGPEVLVGSYWTYREGLVVYYFKVISVSYDSTTMMSSDGIPTFLAFAAHSLDRNKGTMGFPTHKITRLFEKTSEEMYQLHII